MTEPIRGSEYKKAWNPAYGWHKKGLLKLLNERGSLNNCSRSARERSI
jgi:hypothetical protein